jgi:hypothetical protein
MNKARKDRLHKEITENAGSRSGYPGPFAYSEPYTLYDAQLIFNGHAGQLSLCSGHLTGARLGLRGT